MYQTETVFIHSLIFLTLQICLGDHRDDLKKLALRLLAGSDFYSLFYFFIGLGSQELFSAEALFTLYPLYPSLLHLLLSPYFLIVS